jgi:hypothetical protein
MMMAEEQPSAILKKKSAEKRQSTAFGVFGVPLFPSETKEWFTIGKVSREKMDKMFEYETRTFGHAHSNYIYLTLLYLVDYTFGDEHLHRQHSCMSNISSVHADLPGASFGLPLNQNLRPPDVRLDTPDTPFCQAD